MTGPAVDIMLIGGVGRFGMNCLVVRAGGEVAIVDAGMAFPQGDQWGIDAIVPDLDEILDDGVRVTGIFLTHAHDDHIGALPSLLETVSCPVYGSSLTLEFARHALRDRGQEISHRLVAVAGRDRIEAGPFTVEFIHVTHSVPGSFALAIETPAGRILHSADFKLDPTPVEGPPTDLERLAEIGRDGVALALLDSTNASCDGSTPSERTIGARLAPLLARTKGRVFATTFSSHIHRLQQFIGAAIGDGRKVAVLGRRLGASLEIALRAGKLQPNGALVSVEEAMKLPPREALFLAGGSQGEPLSALARLARGEHAEVRIERGDLVAHSARPIPGSEVSIGLMLDGLARQGAEVVEGASSGLHVSGHASAADLIAFLDLARPEAVVPVHGTYRHLLQCAALAESHSRPPRSVLVAENGDIIRLEKGHARLAGRHEPRVRFLDRDRVLVAEEILRERRRIGREGILLPVTIVERASGRPLSDPRVLARGFALPRGEENLWREAERLVAEEVAAGSLEAGGSALEERVGECVGRLVRRRTGKRPSVAPIVLEV